jgi:hypothetical protein
MNSRRKNVSVPRSSFLAATKLSDFQIKKIIRHYAYGKSAAEAARSMRVSYQTVLKTFTLIRWRMEELGLYPEVPDLHEYLRVYKPGEEAPTPRHRFIYDGLRLRRGALARPLGEHIAELYFWSLRPPNWSHERYAERHRIDIIKLVQITGPLNRTVPYAKLALAQSYLDRRRVIGSVKSRSE